MTILQYMTIHVHWDFELMLVLQQAHFIVDEMLMNGSIVETNKQNILAPIQLLEKAS